MNIFVSGSIAYDIILDYPGRFADHIDPKKVHVLSLSFLVKNVKRSVGGTAGNIAYNLAMFGFKPHLLAAVGEDGRDIFKRYRRMPIGIKLLKISKQPTAAAYIMTDSVDNQITGFHAGAMNEQVKLPKVNSKDWAIIAAENPQNMARLARHYQKNKVRYIFDPGQAITVLSKKDLEVCTRGAAIVIGNDYEIDYVFNKLSLRGGTRTKQSNSGLLRDYARNDRDFVVIRTLGPKGSEIVLSNDKKIKIGIAKVNKAVDPTGAGDAYRAGLIVGMTRGFDLKTSAQLGATAAAFAVEKYGTQNHRFSYGILVKRYNKNFSSKI